MTTNNDFFKKHVIVGSVPDKPKSEDDYVKALASGKSVKATDFMRAMGIDVVEQ